MLVILLIAVALLLIILIKWRYSYWQRQGLPYLVPKIPFGCLDLVSKQERSLGMAIYDCYKSTAEKVIGIYLVTRPALLVRDARLARDMLNKDFVSFHDRGIYIDEEHDPMSAGLLAMKGQKWKNLRGKLTPSFTSGKLRAMFETVDGVGDKLVQHLKRNIPEDGSAAPMEMKHLMKMYAIDIIATVIFGLDVNSFEDPNNEFYSVSKQVNHPSYLAAIRGACQFLYPNLETFFNRIGWKEKAPQAMLKLVLETIEYRERTNFSRKDMLQLLLQLRNYGQISENDDNWTAKASKDAFKYMSPEMIAGQLFIFYIAGYETTASTTAFTLYELSQYPEILAKAQQDVQATIEKHGSLTYDALKDMKYLELCIMETIRKYPALPIFNRECTQDYVIPGTDKTIKTGTPVVISIFGIHRDPEYFPDPMVYSPERFLDESRNYDPEAYMPFGEGPRYCIGKRMGMINVKMGLAKILTNFDVEIRTEKKEIEIDNYGVPIQPKGGVVVGLARKKNKQF